MKQAVYPISILVRLVLFLVVAAVTSGWVSCKSIGRPDAATNAAGKVYITEQEVYDAQKAWGEGIVKIGKVYLENQDYKAAAAEHLSDFYYYQEGVVLFKPTLAGNKQFRTDFEGALSYFTGGNSNYPEDKGFAIKPWRSVRWENAGTKIIGNVAISMGNYYFTPEKGGEELKVEYSFAYTKDKSGNLRIILHDSHLPYMPEKK